MKKVIYSISFSLFFLIFASCSNDEKMNNQNINEMKINQVLKMKGESQVLAYMMLNPEEKLQIWESKLTEILNSNKKLNNEQRAFIGEMKLTLDVKYLGSSGIKDKKYLDYLANMKIKGLKIFSKEQLVNYFSSLNYDDSLVNHTEDGVHCNCSSSDDWCITGDCFYWGACSTADGGCGWWLQETCNGFCAKKNVLTPAGSIVNEEENNLD